MKILWLSGCILSGLFFILHWYWAAGITLIILALGALLLWLKNEGRVLLAGGVAWFLSALFWLSAYGIYPSFFDKPGAQLPFLMGQYLLILTGQILEFLALLLWIYGFFKKRQEYLYGWWVIAGIVVLRIILGLLAYFDVVTFTLSHWMVILGNIGLLVIYSRRYRNDC